MGRKTIPKLFASFFRSYLLPYTGIPNKLFGLPLKSGRPPAILALAGDEC
jgi:hypothetical protein